MLARMYNINGKKTNTFSREKSFHPHDEISDEMETPLFPPDNHEDRCHRQVHSQTTDEICVLEAPQVMTPQDALLLTDVNENDVSTIISSLLDVEYLSECTTTNIPRWPVEGIISGRGRHFCAMPVKFGDNTAVWVVFVRVSGAPMTILSSTTFDALGAPNNIPTDGLLVRINNEKLRVHQSPDMPDINILGEDFFSMAELIGIEKRYPSGEEKFIIGPNTCKDEMMQWMEGNT